jgi:hypothetical protein
LKIRQRIIEELTTKGWVGSSDWLDGCEITAAILMQHQCPCGSGKLVNDCGLQFDGSLTLHKGRKWLVTK